MSEFEDQVIGAVTVHFGDRGGKYPDGNSLSVRGRDECVVIDPALGLVARGDARPPADRVLQSHCHEDHVAGTHLYREVPVHLHEADRLGLESLDRMMEIYGFSGPIDAGFRRVLVEQFHYEPRPDARGFEDGASFDLGGGVRIRVIHTPGHTRGHCAFHIEPDDVVYLGDIDLSSFGPYYGDAWSSLEDFERTLARVRDIDARHYATFHHVGVLDGREAFVERLDRYAAVITRREEALIAYLSGAPRSLDEIGDHRFVYRPGDAVPFAKPVEVRSMGMHIERLVAAGRVREVEPGRFLAHEAR